MKSIEIRYLQQGLIKTDMPDNWESLTNDQKVEYCEEILYNLDDRTLVAGLAEILPFDIDRFFASTPEVEAIEIIDYEEDEEPTLVACTSTWEQFVSDYGGLAWKSSPKT